MATPQSPSAHSAIDHSCNFPFPNLEGCATVQNAAGQNITFDINAKVEKGFFQAQCDNKWTCYRRNYFAVTCSYTITPNNDKSSLYYIKGQGQSDKRIKAIAMCVKAMIDGSQGKKVELIQHTPRRDAGSKWEVNYVHVAPLPTGRPEHGMPSHGGFHHPTMTYHPTWQGAMPDLPYQAIAGHVDPYSSQGQILSQSSTNGGYGNGGLHMPMQGLPTSTTFDRIQFKQATANNGKRRASQQFFLLECQVLADVRARESDQPEWVKVACRTSEKIVVRGRSPSHYSNEGAPNQSGRSAGGNNGNSSYTMHHGPSYGPSNPGGFRAANNGYPSRATYPSSYGGGTQYPLVSMESPESPGSVEGGASDEAHPIDLGAHEVDRAGIPDHPSYSYHPFAQYDPVIPNAGPNLPLPKIESSGTRGTTEPANFQVTHGHGLGLFNEYPEATPGPSFRVYPNAPRFQGFESSSGFYPEFGPAPFA
ncbi:uncharacterized protein LTR77_007920 [Saxophila tyrrhenica]|uniref:NDT80 domain-containing protein n=1 Tax=Saxophila tyrrhenica TaxID=1690608 RepID=A0AAV9P3G0_9PEZI|nr:hypothetical protein LTR77_007920 [Saxophila tyrrhenica]